MHNQSQLRSWCRGLQWMEGHLAQLFTPERGWLVKAPPSPPERGWLVKAPPSPQPTPGGAAAASLRAPAGGVGDPGRATKGCGRGRSSRIQAAIFFI